MKSIIIIIFLDILFLYTMLFEMQMLQQNSYNDKKRYLKFWLSDLNKNSQNYLLKFWLGIVLLMFGSATNFFIIFFMIITSVLVLSAYVTYQKHNQKLPLKFTKRVKRIMSLDIILFLIFQLVLTHYKLTVFAGALTLFICFNGLILMLCVFALKPIEKHIFNHYKKEALNKLNKMNGLKIIGITGSFGKTSTKVILDTILKTKYKGFFTPASFNTPNGVLMTINSEPTIFNDYFISEMGAKNIGDIKELCDLVRPKYGILTSVGKAHLESFKSLENVCKTKFELIESLPCDGIAILNKDDEYQKEYKLKNKCKVVWIGINSKADVIAKNIKITSKGTSYDICFKDKKSIKVNTVLLGNKNIYNILAAVALSKELGVSDKEIIEGVKNIAPISHRLEIRCNQNITIIDDSFNSNPEGAKMALEVLDLMEGNKVIITPGMVEMGKEQDDLNKTFGMQIADVCDKVYLVGKKQTKPIYEGLIEKKYAEEKIFIYNSFKDAYNAVLKDSGKKKVTVLIENDLPDSYMEV